MQEATSPIMGGVDFNAVSYTHLDVYKRQEEILTCVRCTSKQRCKRLLCLTCIAAVFMTGCGTKIENAYDTYSTDYINGYKMCIRDRVKPEAGSTREKESKEI